MTTDNRNDKGQFLSGHIGGPGRPKGSRNRLGEAFTEKLLEDFEKHGIAAIEKVRAEDPSTYLRVIAQIVPKDLQISASDESAAEGLSDEELFAELERARAATAARLGSARGGGTTPSSHH